MFDSFFLCAVKSSKKDSIGNYERAIFSATSVNIKNILSRAQTNIKNIPSIALKNLFLMQ
jgi:hypothetical protein